MEVIATILLLCCVATAASTLWCEVNVPWPALIVAAVALVTTQIGEPMEVTVELFIAAYLAWCVPVDQIEIDKGKGGA